MSTHNLCFEQKYEKYQSFLSENFQFLEVKFSIYMYLNRCVFVMEAHFHTEWLKYIPQPMASCSKHPYINALI